MSLTFLLLIVFLIILFDTIVSGIVYFVSSSDSLFPEIESSDWC